MATGDKLVNLDALKLVYDSTYTRDEIDDFIETAMLPFRRLSGVNLDNVFTDCIGYAQNCSATGLTSNVYGSFMCLAGTSESSSGNRCMQIVWGVAADGGTIRYRTHVTSWSNWYTLAQGGIVPIPSGGTGANSVSGARTNLNVYSKDETIKMTLGFNGNIDTILYPCIMHINDATGTTTGGITSNGKFHGLLITVANSAGNRAVQFHVSIWNNGAAMRRYETDGWTEWTKLAKATEQQRYIDVSYSLNAGASMHTNLKTLIDADMPSGYTWGGLSGFMSGNSNVCVIACAYANTEWTLQLKNFGTSTITTDARIYYIAKPT